MSLNRKKKNFKFYWKFSFIILVCLAILNNSYAQLGKPSLQPLTILNVSDTVICTSCTYNCKITVKYKPTDLDSLNYVFDSIWVFSAIPDRQRTLISKHFISQVNFNNLFVLIINYKTRIGNQGMLAEPRECERVPYFINYTIGDVRVLIPETVRLYYTYKGKYKIARYYKNIDNRPTLEEERKRMKRNQLYEKNRE